MVAAQRKENNAMVAFLDHFDFINPLTKDTKILLGYYCKDHTFHMGQEIFNEGDPVEHIYLVNHTF